MIKKRVLFYGDSNTYGFDPGDPWGARYETEDIWTGILEKNLSIEALNYGENGREIPHNKYHFAELDRIIKKEAPFDCFAVMLGTNDLFSIYDVDAVRITGRMKKLLGFVKNHQSVNENTKILLISPAKVILRSSIYEESFTLISEELGEYYRALSEEEKVFFADAGKWNIDLAFDGVHFSEEGHRVFAGHMCTVLKECGIV